MGGGKNASIMYTGHFTSRAVRGIIFNNVSDFSTVFLFTCYTLKT